MFEQFKPDSLPLPLFFPKKTPKFRILRKSDLIYIAYLKTVEVLQGVMRWNISLGVPF